MTTAISARAGSRRTAPDRLFGQGLCALREAINPRYIEGAVVISYQGKTLMGEDLWDDINYLWPFLMNSLPEISEGKDWQTVFPDQPITFSVEHIAPDWLLLHVYAEDEEYVKKRVPKFEYVSEMVRGGRDFLSRLYRICPAADLPSSTMRGCSINCTRADDSKYPRSYRPFDRLPRAGRGQFLHFVFS